MCSTERTRGADFRQGGGLRGLRARYAGDVGKEADADSGLSDNAQPLAPCAVAGARRRVGGVYAAANHDACSALALASEDRRVRTSLPGHVQVISDRGGRAPSDGPLLRGAKCLACRVGRARGGLAMVESVALAAPGSGRGCAAADGLADGTAATLVATSEPAGSERSVGGVANRSSTWPTLWQRDLAGDDCRETRTRIHFPTSRKTKEAQIIGLIPFSLA